MHENNDFSFPKDEQENQLSLNEAIEGMFQQKIEAVMQVEFISTQLALLLQQQSTKVNGLIQEGRKKKKVPMFLRDMYAKQQGYWHVLLNETEMYHKVSKDYRTWLEAQQEECQDILANFEHLQEEFYLL